jgi:hypothetical protein
VYILLESIVSAPGSDVLDKLNEYNTTYLLECILVLVYLRSSLSTTVKVYLLERKA